MKKNNFQNVAEVFDAVRLIQDRLRASGEESSVAAITEIVDGFWTTASEALAETITVLIEITPVWENVVDEEDKTLLSDTLNGARKLIDLR